MDKISHIFYNNKKHFVYADSFALIDMVSMFIDQKKLKNG